MSSKKKGIIVKITEIFPLTNYMEIKYVLQPKFSETKAWAFCKEEYIEHAFVFNKQSSLLKKFYKVGVKEISSIIHGKGIEETEHILVNKEPKDEEYLYRRMTQGEMEDFSKRVTVKFQFPKINDNILNKKNTSIN